MLTNIRHLYLGYSDLKKLWVILLIGLLVRLVAVFFSAGYGMHDDHFLVVEIPSSWVHGFDTGAWLPETQEKQIEKGWRDEIRPQGHSLFIPGVQYGYFWFMDALGIDNPNTLMVLNRFLYALLSLFGVFMSYIVTKQISNTTNARTVAWVMALGWAMPYLSVRNLVEVICIPFLLLAVYLTFKGKLKNAIYYGLLAGLVMSIAVSIRYQTVVFLGVFGLIVLIQKNWKLGFSILLSFLFGFTLIQGLPDYFIWGYPFAELIEYISYNASDVRYEYAEDLGGKTYGLNYILILAVITLPIFGIFWLIGFFSQWKKHAILFFPALAFLLFHMAYVNAQERFIFPIFPFVLILGVIGWETILKRHETKIWIQKMNRIALIFGVFINLILLIFLSTYYGKRARVESMLFLANDQRDRIIIHENSFDGYLPLLPRFYGKKWGKTVYKVRHSEFFENLKPAIDDKGAWLYFQGNQELDQRVQRAQSILPRMKKVKEFEASFLDEVIQRINPINRNESIILYEIPPL